MLNYDVDLQVFLNGEPARAALGIDVLSTRSEVVDIMNNGIIDKINYVFDRLGIGYDDFYMNVYSAIYLESWSEKLQRLGHDVKVIGENLDMQLEQSKVEWKIYLAD